MTHGAASRRGDRGAAHPREAENPVLRSGRVLDVRWSSSVSDRAGLDRGIGGLDFGSSEVRLRSACQGARGLPSVAWAAPARENYAGPHRPSSPGRTRVRSAPSPARSRKRRVDGRSSRPPAASLVTSQVPVVLGRRQARARARSIGCSLRSHQSSADASAHRRHQRMSRRLTNRSVAGYMSSRTGPTARYPSPVRPAGAQRRVTERRTPPAAGARALLLWREVPARERVADTPRGRPVPQPLRGRAVRIVGCAPAASAYEVSGRARRLPDCAARNAGGGSADQVERRADDRLGVDPVVA